MSPHRFFSSALCLTMCLGTSSCESPLTVQEQQRVARVIPWVNGTYALDPRQGLDYVDPMSPYRGGLRPAAGYHWRTSDMNDFATVPYRGGPYLFYPKYPLLASPPASPSSWQENSGRYPSSGRAPQNRQPDDSEQQAPLSNPGRFPQPQAQPPDAAPSMELEPAPPERNSSPPASLPPPPPRSVPRDKPV